MEVLMEVPVIRSKKLQNCTTLGEAGFRKVYLFRKKKKKILTYNEM
jgi:hypothetical protein